AGALTRLSEASGVPVAFSPSLIAADRRPVECRCRDLTVGQALDRLLEERPFRYREIRGEILVYRDTDADELTDDYLGRNGRGLLATLGDALPLDAPASESQAPQGAVVQGRVTDVANGQPLVGARVAIVGTQLGALTGETGQFRIAGVPAGEHVIRADLIGYRGPQRTVTVAAADVVPVDIAMSHSAVELEGLVAAALGMEREGRTLTTSVQRLDGESIARVRDGNLVASLSGKVSGV